MRKLLVVVLVSVAIAVALALLHRSYLLSLGRAAGTSSMAPTTPACNGRWLVEGFTYRFRDPRRGEIAVFHASGRLGGAVRPDPDARDLAIGKRVVGVPGDRVQVRDGRVVVNGTVFDEITTEPFPATTVGEDEYFVLGDNRSFSQDSRAFGAVPRDAIFGRLLLVYWPLGDFGPPEERHAGDPPGGGLCD